MHFQKSLYSIVLATAVAIATVGAHGANVSPEVKDAINCVVKKTMPAHMGIGNISARKVDVDQSKKLLTVDLSGNYAYVPFDKAGVESLKKEIMEAAGTEYAGYRLKLNIGGEDIDSFLPINSPRKRGKKDARFITRLSEPQYTEGLDGNIIAMWQSHGWYFEPKLNRWEWQRARIFQTVEDLYTQSYVLPFLVPMLENAGAYVFLPRERDTNDVEIIIDNDGGRAVSGYAEINGTESWGGGEGEGFAYNRKQYIEKQNPFNEGTYRVVKGVKDASKASKATWNAKIPRTAEYALYVSYKSLPQSAEDVVYTVNYMGGSKEFKINQKMGGGTWIYLGTFPLERGRQEKPIVEISNLTNGKKAVITADAVKIGGGYGNVARRVKEGAKTDKNLGKSADDPTRIDYKHQLSGYPRFTEGARYWMQWAGIPDTVYTTTDNENDYTDDYRSRGYWVNYLAGGSKVLPKHKGLNIPVDLSFAFHTDAGTTMDDSIIGTLGIYSSRDRMINPDGTPRMISRELTDMVMTNIVNDIRAQFEPNWTRRGMWDKEYSEAYAPYVPAMLLELLSHQNFADMKYGLDPTFRFLVSRAIYKGMLQFIAKREGREYMVQPLPVNSFAITPKGENRYTLTWKATPDTLTANSDASSFVVMERINNGGFREIATVEQPVYDFVVNDNDIHSFQIIAQNAGGRSFPSEILAMGVAPDSKGEIMVVNGFTRVSAPDNFDAGKIAGFYDERDHGMPYQKDISFIGSQFEYRRDIPWMDDDAAGFGASRADYEDKVIAGNTFDYPVIHGRSIMKAGYSFVSASRKAVEDGEVSLKGYKLLDLILGKQKEVMIGRGAVPNRYRAFTPALQKAITEFTKDGGSVFVTGSYVATDIWDNKNTSEADKKFAQDVLGYTWRVGQASVTGDAYVVPTGQKYITEGVYEFSNNLNPDIYMVESPDSFFATDSKNGETLMRYCENNLVAGIIANKPGYRTCVIGFPFETIRSQKQRDRLMDQVIKYLTSK